MSHEVLDHIVACRFLFAGKARFTIRSKKTGDRFTYRIMKSDDGNVFFVQALVGCNNDLHYRYVGHVKANNKGSFIFGKKSRVPQHDKRVAAISWFLQKIQDHVPETVELWHEGKCGRCGRTLTVPESIASGIGPECANHLR